VYAKRNGKRHDRKHYKIRERAIRTSHSSH
jgi:hypothetical protein